MACARGLSFASHLAIAAAMAASALVGNPDPAGAQTYPRHVVTVVVPFPAGGPIDLAARVLSEKLAARLKQPFVIENRPGAAGNLGTDFVAKAAPDGHTLLMVLDTPLTANVRLYSKLPFDPERDFAPISLIATFSQMLVVHPSVPANSLAEFVNFAKAQPITHGSGGAKGNPGYLAMELLRLKAGFEILQVGYRGNPQVVADLTAGHVQAGFLATPSVIDLALAGKLRPLAVSSKQRELGALEVPTIEEAGYPGVIAEFGLVVLAPAGTPELIRATLEREVLAALKSPNVQAQLRGQHLHPASLSSSDTAAWLKAVRDEWAGVIDAANIRLD
jgi:tripartite-type tricarboxylate transporter receptor subunit TctC